MKKTNIPQSRVPMPVKLSAEDGHKELLSGEFKVQIESYDEYLEGVPTIDVHVPWSTIKEIYASVVQFESLKGNPWGWISVQEALPPKHERVYGIVESTNYKGKILRLQTIVRYISALTEPAGSEFDDVEDWADYDEESDEWYIPQGFYEHSLVDEYIRLIPEGITHWMPLLELPKAK